MSDDGRSPREVDPAVPDAPEDDASLAPPRTVRSEDLLLDQRELLIVHCQDVYRLRLTRNGKLILTK